LGRIVFKTMRSKKTNLKYVKESKSSEIHPHTNTNLRSKQTTLKESKSSEINPQTNTNLTQTNKFIILVIVLSILIQPNSIKDTSDIFTCQEIEDKYYLTAEMTEECYTKNHEKWVL